jgi:hypothetical protein
MTDIIVRVPKKEVEHFWEDTLLAYEFWALGRTPVDLKVGNFIWFQIDKQIVARAPVDSIGGSAANNLVDKNADTQQSITCETTGRRYTGCLVFWRSTDFEKLNHPLPGTNLQRGFCYKR